MFDEILLRFNLHNTYRGLHIDYTDYRRFRSQVFLIRIKYGVPTRYTFKNVFHTYPLVRVASSSSTSVLIFLFTYVVPRYII